MLRYILRIMQLSFFVYFLLKDLTVILSTLLPVVCIYNDSKEHSSFSVGLKVNIIIVIYYYFFILFISWILEFCFVICTRSPFF